MCVNMLEEPQSQSLAEEKQSHAMALQALEKQAKEDLLSERNRLQTMHHLELGNTHAHRHMGISINTHRVLHMHSCIHKMSICTHTHTHSDMHIEILNSTVKLRLPWIHFTMATAERYL